MKAAVAAAASACVVANAMVAIVVQVAAAKVTASVGSYKGCCGSMSGS